MSYLCLSVCICGELFLFSIQDRDARPNFPSVRRCDRLTQQYKVHTLPHKNKMSMPVLSKVKILLSIIYKIQIYLMFFSIDHDNYEATFTKQ